MRKPIANRIPLKACPGSECCTTAPLCNPAGWGEQDASPSGPAPSTRSLNDRTPEEAYTRDGGLAKVRLAKFRGLPRHTFE